MRLLVIISFICLIGITIGQLVTYQPRRTSIDSSYLECQQACNVTCRHYCPKDLCEKYGPRTPPLGTSRFCRPCECPNSS